MFADYQGELAALSSALLWAVSSVVYTRLGQRLPPLSLNLAKGALAIAMVGCTLLLQAEAIEINLRALALLAISGICGIGCGDTAYFSALNCLGPRRTLLLGTLAPPMATVLAWVFLGEGVSARSGIGIFLVLSGVAWVISERSISTPADSSKQLRGLGFALVAALAQASGAVLSRAALAETSVTPLWATLVRLSAGEAILLLAWWRQPPLPGFRLAFSVRLWAILGVTAFFSTYLAIWLQQTSLKFAPAGIAQTLSATSPLFVLPLAIWMGERVSGRSILGVVIAVAGIAFLFF
ncbi:MAG TPA: DMT family transporter [Oscillatoriales cyanobacterium M59_W2019_021]|nr:DMT family transporter [Oscillatoriales cyanobacterium M4454_W2019_049]HIK51276.1 DMT family transporter [Oscillatoriales cyanobacterium M59_W2019_021]